MYSYLLRVMDEYVQKCSVTLKSISGQIEPVIRELARNENEYEFLMDKIPRFYRDTYNSSKTHLYIRSRNYNSRIIEEDEELHREWTHQTRNDGHWIEVPEEAKKEGKDIGFQVMMTNKTDWHGGISYPDTTDLNRMGLYNSKFLVVVGDDGLTITENNTRVVEGSVWHPDRYSNDYEFISAMGKIDRGRKDRVESNSAVNGLDSVREEYRNTRAGSRRDKEKRDKIQKITAEEWRKNSSVEISEANRILNENGFDWKIHHIPIKKTYE